MGRPKGNVDANSDSYQRANFLCQAGQILSCKSSALSQYYGYQAKEVMKKIVGKMHPDLKQTLCPSCSYPTTIRKTKICSYKVKRKRNPRPRSEMKQKTKKKSRKTARNKHPNRVLWQCYNCLYRRVILQRPSHTLGSKNRSVLS